MSDSEYEFSCAMELSSDEEALISDYDLHYCESSPSYYCEEFYCELKEFGYKCPNKEVDRT